MVGEAVGMTLTPAQLELRKGATGSSEISGVVQMNPHLSRFTVYLRKIGDAPPQEVTRRMVYGNVFEEPLAQIAALELGGTVVPCESKFHPTFPFLLATLDRIITLPNGDRGGLEIKTSFGWSSSMEWGEEWTDQVPGHYLCQTQIEMAVEDLRWCIVLVLLHGEPKFYRVERDDSLIDMLAEENEAFWRRHVLPRIPPPPDGTDDFTRSLRHRYREHKRPELVPGNDDVARWAEEYRQACEAEAAWAKRKKEPRQLLELFIGDAAGVEGPWGRISWKSRKPVEAVDWPAVAAEAGIPVELIQKHTTTKPGSRDFRPTWKEKK